MATTSPTRKDKSGRRRKVTKFALAGVAVLGVGAALTSAAWTDNVWFAGSASAGSFELQGSTDGVSWVDADTNGVAIASPSDSFLNLGPNVTKTVTVYLHNAGSVNVNLDSAVPASTGALFAGAKPAQVSVGGFVESNGDHVLEPNADATFTVSVTGGNWNDSEYQGLGGNLTVVVQGSS